MLGEGGRGGHALGRRIVVHQGLHVLRIPQPDQFNEKLSACSQ